MAMRKRWKIKDTSKMHHTPWNKGKKLDRSKYLVMGHLKKHSEKSKRKMKKSHLGLFVGEKSALWKGGITIVDRLIRRMTEYYQWRSDVFQRDNWICKTCGENGCYVTAHHIKGLNKIIREYNIKNVNDARKCQELWDINNGITLCEGCHKLTDNYRGKAIKK